MDALNSLIREYKYTFKAGNDRVFNLESAETPTCTYLTGPRVKVIPCHASNIPYGTDLLNTDKN